MYEYSKNFAVDFDDWYRLLDAAKTFWILFQLNKFRVSSGHNNLIFIHTAAVHAQIIVEIVRMLRRLTSFGKRWHHSVPVTTFSAVAAQRCQEIESQYS